VYSDRHSFPAVSLEELQGCWSNSRAREVEVLEKGTDYDVIMISEFKLTGYFSQIYSFNYQSSIGVIIYVEDLPISTPLHLHVPY